MGNMSGTRTCVQCRDALISVEICLILWVCNSFYKNVLITQYQFVAAFHLFLISSQLVEGGALSANVCVFIWSGGEHVFIKLCVCQRVHQQSEEEVLPVIRVQ